MKKVIDKVIFFGGWSVLVAYFVANLFLIAGLFGYTSVQEFLLWIVS